MAKVYINKIEYGDNFNKISDSKIVFNRMYKRYKDPKDENRVFTIVSAMTAVARGELKERGSFKEVYQRIYDVIRGYDIDRPRCVVCREREVEWNDKTFKYNRMCGSPACKEKLRADYRNNMMVSHGTDNPMNIPGHANKMLQSRDIAIDYEWSDGEIKTMIGKQEYAIAESLDNDCGLKSFEVQVPGPQISYYHAADKKTKLHIPDIFIPKYNLIISGKDGVDNPNTHPNYQKDRLNSIYEYIHILNNTDYNFIQIEGAGDVKNLKHIISNVEKAHSSGSRYIIPPRVDIMMVKNSLGEDESTDDVVEDIHFTYILNSQGTIVLSWFSMNDITRGCIISNGKFMWYDFKKLFNGRIKICTMSIKRENALKTLNSNVAASYRNNLQLMYDLRNCYTDVNRNSIGDIQWDYSIANIYERGCIDDSLRRADIVIGLTEVELIDVFHRYTDKEYEYGQLIAVVSDKHGSISYRFNICEENSISLTYNSKDNTISLSRNIRPRCIFTELITIERRTAEALYYIMQGLLSLNGDNVPIRITDMVVANHILDIIKPDIRVATLCNISHSLVKYCIKYFGDGIEKILAEDNVMSANEFRDIVFSGVLTKIVGSPDVKRGGRDEIHISKKAIEDIAEYAGSHIKNNKNTAEQFKFDEDEELWSELAIFRQGYSYIKTRDEACLRLKAIFDNTTTK